jgi:hypothetical protein
VRQSRFFVADCSGGGMEAKIGGASPLMQL